MIIDKFKETVNKYSMLSPGDRVLVAVSGGPDSVCLLSLLHALAKDLDLELQVAHLDHMFRGAESAQEALFVAKLADKFGIPATIEQIDVPSFCRTRGMSSQEGAREARYDFLYRTAEATGSSRIATGHTADDQAETFLMRLARGAGISGLSAIPPVRDNIIRPLIEITRGRVLEHLNSKGLEFMTDPSNTKPLYTRNRIRIEIMPLLKRLNPRIVETLAAETALIRDEDEAVEAYLSTLADHMITQNEEALFAKRDEFNILPPAFRRRLLRRIVNLAGAESLMLSLDQINNALSFMAAAQTGRTLILPRGLTICREYNRFVISAKATADGFCYTLTVPGMTPIPVIGLEIETRIHQDRSEEPASLENYLWQAMFDYDKIGRLLTLRTRQPGDWFRPAGMGGKSKKLQDFFVDEKIPGRKRNAVPLLCSGENILWVVGQRTDERFLPGTGTQQILTVGVRNTNV